MIALKKKTTNLKKFAEVNSWYKNCSELPLYNFIKATITNDVTWLKISGNPSDEDLHEAWSTIQGDFEDMQKDSQSDYLLNLISQITYTDERLRIIYNVVSILEIKRSEALISILQNELGFNYEYSEESLQRDLKLTLSEIKMDQVNLELSRKEYEDYKAKGKPVTELDYDKLISRLSKYQGYHIKSKEITVTQFISILNDFTETNSPKKLIPTDEN